MHQINFLTGDHRRAIPSLSWIFSGICLTSPLFSPRLSQPPSMHHHHHHHHRHHLHHYHYLRTTIHRTPLSSFAFLLLWATHPPQITNKTSCSKSFLELLPHSNRTYFLQSVNLWDSGPPSYDFLPTSKSKSGYPSLSISPFPGKP